MGILTKLIKECPKLDLAFTVIEFVSLSDGAHTTVKIVDAQYSIRGTVVKTIEFPSFDGVFAPIYQESLAEALSLAQKCEAIVRSGNIVLLLIKLSFSYQFI